MSYTYPSEAEFSDAIADYLELGGWTVEREIHAKQWGGWVDVMAIRDGKTIIVEAKLKAKKFKLASRQIARYRLDFPEALFFFATPEPITAEIEDSLLQESILCFPSERLYDRCVQISRIFIYSEQAGLTEWLDANFQFGRRSKSGGYRKSELVEEVLRKFPLP